MNKVLFFIIIMLLNFACTKLVRDNPLDYKNNTNMQNGISLKANSYVVYDAYTGNNDGKINVGETANLIFYIRNTGDSVAQGVTATFNSSNSNIIYLDNNAKYFGTINPGDSSYNATSQVKITISKNVKIGDIIPINLTIKDNKGGIWYEKVYIIISKIYLTYNIKNLTFSENNFKMAKGSTNKFFKLTFSNYKNLKTEFLKAKLFSTNTNLSITTNKNFKFINILQNNISKYFENILINISNEIYTNNLVTINVLNTDRYKNYWLDLCKNKC